jgi:hypothetical protein
MDLLRVCSRDYSWTATRMSVARPPGASWKKAGWKPALQRRQPVPDYRSRESDAGSRTEIRSEDHLLVLTVRWLLTNPGIFKASSYRLVGHASQISSQLDPKFHTPAISICRTLLRIKWNPFYP